MTRLPDITVKMRLDSSQFEKDLRRLHRETRRAKHVPGWCYVPWARAFIVGNALAAPLLVLLYAVTR